MRHHQLCHKAAAVLALLVSVSFAPLASAQITNPPELCPPGYTGKLVVLPARIDHVPQTNDFSNPDSQYSFKHSKSTDNFVLFWDKAYGDNPMTDPPANRRFDVDAILKEADRFYNFYINDMKFVDKDHTFATKYKFLFIVIGGNGGTATGGTVQNGGEPIGAFWTPASRINRGPYGVVAHELGHSFQAITQVDAHAPRFTGGGAINEMTSQWMLWQVYDWLGIETFHLNNWMKTTQLAFLCDENEYNTAGILEYWSEKHGIEIMGKLWRGVQRGEDPVMTYKRITGITQDQFNDEILDASRKFVTWDLPRIKEVDAKFANQHTTSIFATNDGYQIGWTNAPQNYGYNAIKLKVPAAGTKVTIDFKGIVGADGYKSVHPEWAGWRYGFLAYESDGTRVYSDAFSKSPGTGEFTVPANTTFLWLVVTGAPTEHWIHVAGGRAGGGGRGRRGANATNAPPGTNGIAAVTPGGARGGNAQNSNAGEQWPYFFKIAGTTPDDSIVH